MAYQSSGYGNGGGYSNNQQGGGYNRGGNQGGGYNKSQYTPPRKEFNLDEEAGKYGMVYTSLVEQLVSQGIKIEDVKDYLGGWTTSIKINLDKAGG